MADLTLRSFEVTFASRRSAAEGRVTCSRLRCGSANLGLIFVHTSANSALLNAALFPRSRPHGFRNFRSLQERKKQSWSNSEQKNSGLATIALHNGGVQRSCCSRFSVPPLNLMQAIAEKSGKETFSRSVIAGLMLNAFRA